METLTPLAQVFRLVLVSVVRTDRLWPQPSLEAVCKLLRSLELTLTDQTTPLVSSQQSSARQHPTSTSSISSIKIREHPSCLEDN